MPAIFFALFTEDSIWGKKKVSINIEHLTGWCKGTMDDGKHVGIYQLYFASNCKAAQYKAYTKNTKIISSVQEYTVKLRKNADTGMWSNKRNNQWRVIHHS